jgi:hypothetical protein
METCASSFLCTAVQHILKCACTILATDELSILFEGKASRAEIGAALGYAITAVIKIFIVASMTMTMQIMGIGVH